MNSFSLGAWIMIGVVVVEILALIAIIISLSKAGRVVEVHRQPANAYGGQPGGYPPAQQSGGYPSSQSPSGFPPAGDTPPAYPPQG